MVVSEKAGKDGEIRALLHQAIVDGTRSGTPLADHEDPAVDASIILERKPDAGNPHVRFDEWGRGKVVKEKN